MVGIKLTRVLFVVTVLMFISACGNIKEKDRPTSSEDSTSKELSDDSVIRSGRYYILKEENGFPPMHYVLFDFQNQTFDFGTETIESSNSRTGKLAIKDDILIARTDIGQEKTFVFRILDNETLIFVSTESDNLIVQRVKISDGTKLIWQND